MRSSRRDLMKGMLALAALSIGGIPFEALSAEYQQIALGRKAPTPIIWCDDWSLDMDGLMFLAKLIALHQRGLIVLVGLSINSKNNTLSQRAAYALLQMAGLFNTPVWVYNGSTYSTNQPGNWNASVALLFGGFVPSSAPSGHIQGWFQTLQRQADGSVVVFMTGLASSIAEFLANAGGTYSGLSGKQMWARKVKRVYWEAGLSPSNAGPVFNTGLTSQAPEYNLATVAGAITSAQYVVNPSNWPQNVPLIWSGDEQPTNTTSGPPSNTSPWLSPYLNAQAVYLSSLSAPRTSWAEPALMVEVFAGAGLWTTNNAYQNGTMAIDASGNNSWSSTAGVHSLITTLAYGTAQQNAAKSIYNSLVSGVTAGAVTSTATNDWSALSPVQWIEGATSTISSAGTTSMTVSDLSGNSNTLIVPSSTYDSGRTGPNTTTVNGNTAILFNGSTDILACDAIATAIFASSRTIGSGLQPFYIAQLWKLGASIPAEQTFLDIGPAGETFTTANRYLNRIVMKGSGTTNYKFGRIGAASSAPIINGAMVANGYALIELFFDPNLTGAVNGNFVGQCCNLLGPMLQLNGTVNQTYTGGTALSTMRIGGSEPSSDATTTYYPVNATLCAHVILPAVPYDKPGIFGEVRASRLRKWNNVYGAGLTRI